MSAVSNDATETREVSATELAAHQAWQAQRHEALTAATGNLSLTQTRWLPTGTTAEAAAEQIAAARAAANPTSTVTELSRRNIKTGEPEFGLRVWDAQAPAIQAFDHVDTFDFNPDWVIDATFSPVSTDRTVPFEHIRDAGGTRDLVVPGDITFERDGETFTLAAFDDDGTLLLVFGDPTNRATDGTQSYGSGRFLFVEREAGHDTEGAVRLDFNRAFVPPCGFSAQYNCPMPPPQNRLPWAVLAGERIPLFNDDFDIYA